MCVCVRACVHACVRVFVCVCVCVCVLWREVPLPFDESTEVERMCGTASSIAPVFEDCAPTDRFFVGCMIRALASTPHPILALIL